MTYGTAAAVGALAQTWTLNGQWVDSVAEVVADPLHVPPIVGVAAVVGTNPNLTQVNKWLSEVTGMMDVALQTYGFITPVVQVDALKAIDMIVESVVADLCHAANSSGRFYTEHIIESGVSPMTVIGKQLDNWVNGAALGLENLGVPRRMTKSPNSAFSIPPAKQL